MIVAGTGTRQIIAITGAMEFVIDTLMNVMRVGLDKFGEEFRVISGMAEGFDEAMALAAINVGVPFYAYVPGPGYADYYWSKNSLTGRDRGSEFADIISQASAIHWSTNTNTLYLPDARNKNNQPRLHINFIRNFDMVDDADRIWAYDPKSRGTQHCVRYARRVGKRIWLVPPFQT